MIFNKNGRSPTTMRNTRQVALPIVIRRISSYSARPKVSLSARLTAAAFSCGIPESSLCKRLSPSKRNQHPLLVPPAPAGPLLHCRAVARRSRSAIHIETLSTALGDNLVIAIRSRRQHPLLIRVAAIWILRHRSAVDQAVVPHAKRHAAVDRSQLV